MSGWHSHRSLLSLGHWCQQEQIHDLLQQWRILRGDIALRDTIELLPADGRQSGLDQEGHLHEKFRLIGIAVDQAAGQPCLLRLDQDIRDLL